MKTRLWSDGDGVFIVAEMANAHAGDVDEALRIVDAAAEAGADAIKVQIFTPDELAIPAFSHYKAYGELQMEEDSWVRVRKRTRDLGIQMIADVFGPDSLALMDRVGADAYMVHAADIGNEPLLTQLSRGGRPVLVSAGGSNWLEVGRAIDVLSAADDVQVVVMHGFQGYPTAVEDSHLRRIGLYRARFGVPVGFASHVDGGSDEALVMPAQAAAAGAELLEVHITLDRAAKGHDYFSALEPDRFRKMVEEVRAVEPGFGAFDTKLPEKEIEYRNAHRKWVVAQVDLAVGDVLDGDKIALKRTPDGGSPNAMTLGDCLGREVSEPVRRHDVIKRTHVKNRVVAALACRAESTRLFGKPLQLLGDRPIMGHLIDQLRKASCLDEIVLAISEGPSQELFIDYARQHDLPYVTGAGRDVLGRMIKAAESVGGDIVLRNTTENAFIYWENLDELIERHVANGNDLTVTENLPVAAFVEVISRSALEKAHRFGEDRHRSELVTLFIAENPDLFQIERVTPPANLRRPEIRLAVDTPEDLSALRRIYDAVHRPDEAVTLAEVIAFMDANSDVKEILRTGDTLYFWK